jgi:hypothetical protein
VELLGRAAEALVAGHGEEDLELAERHPIRFSLSGR